MNKLTHRERRFVTSFVGEANGNAAKAARMAGYSGRTARVQASQLLTKLNVRAAIEEHTEAADRKAVALARERDLTLTTILRNARLDATVRIRAIHELNKVEGRHIQRHQVAGKLTLEDIVEACRRLEEGDM